MLVKSWAGPGQLQNRGAMLSCDVSFLHYLALVSTIYHYLALSCHLVLVTSCVQDRTSRAAAAWRNGGCVVTSCSQKSAARHRTGPRHHHQPAADNAALTKLLTSSRVNWSWLMVWFWRHQCWFFITISLILNIFINNKGSGVPCTQLALLYYRISSIFCIGPPDHWHEKYATWPKLSERTLDNRKRYRFYGSPFFIRENFNIHKKMILALMFCINNIMSWEKERVKYIFGRSCLCINVISH